MAMLELCEMAIRHQLTDLAADLCRRTWELALGYAQRKDPALSELMDALEYLDGSMPTHSYTDKSQKHGGGQEIHPSNHPEQDWQGEQRAEHDKVVHFWHIATVKLFDNANQCNIFSNARAY